MMTVGRSVLAATAYQHEPYRLADLFADVLTDQRALLNALLREHAPRVHRAPRKLERRLRALLAL